MSKLQNNEINISEFKTHCLRLLDETGRKGKEYIIVRNGVPLAKVIPFNKKRKSPRGGSLKGLIKTCGDIVHFDTSDEWEALKP